MKLQICYSPYNSIEIQIQKPQEILEALIEEILIERRKELYGEMGVEWFDAKRLRRASLEQEIIELEVLPIYYLMIKSFSSKFHKRK